MSFRILVADESLPIRRLVCRFLEAVGISRPEETASGEETLAKLSSDRFDLAIVEINMTGAGPNGLELIEAILAAQPSVKLVVMTTEADEATIQSTLEAGAVEYLIKPFGVAERQRLLELCQHEQPQSLSQTE